MTSDDPEGGPPGPEATGESSGVAADAVAASKAARWLLNAAADGIALTQTLALSRACVREAAERFPDWWDADLHGPPHREADLRLLEELHAGLRRLRLARRRGRKLYATARGRELAVDPPALVRGLAADLGGGDAFAESLARVVVATLAVDQPRTYEQLTASAFPRLYAEGWQTGHGVRLAERDLAWALSDVVSRGVAYGILARHDTTEPRSYRSLITLTRAGAVALGLPIAGLTGVPVLVFDARLLSGLGRDVPGVSARIAVASYQHLTALHDAILAAFGWDDDHLYSFWLDGRFWGAKDTEYTRPHTPDMHHIRPAYIPINELELATGATVAYVFDFGDEWRVELTLREQAPADGGPYPRVLAREGTAPPQYPPLQDE
jgi:hypothetical protein